MKKIYMSPDMVQLLIDRADLLTASTLMLGNSDDPLSEMDYSSFFS